MRKMQGSNLACIIYLSHTQNITQPSCSRACQISHWQDHKSTCAIVHDPLNYNPSADTKATPAYARTMQLTLDMRSRGRLYPSVYALLEAWCKHCMYGGTVAVAGLKMMESFTLMRGSEGGQKELQLLKHTRSKTHKTPRPKDTVDVKDADRDNVVRYMVHLCFICASL